jgi:hypothetical protein
MGLKPTAILGQYYINYVPGAHEMPGSRYAVS